jgi:hypothetical protein
MPWPGYLPMIAFVAMGIVFATHTRARLDRLESERSEARDYSVQIEAKFKEFTHALAKSEQNLLYLCTVLAEQKVTGTPISDDEARAAAELVLRHQATIESLLDE